MVEIEVRLEAEFMSLTRRSEGNQLGLSRLGDSVDLVRDGDLLAEQGLCGGLLVRSWWAVEEDGGGSVVLEMSDDLP